MDHVIIYDGICNLCCGFVRLVKRHDRSGKFNFIPYQSEAAIKIITDSGLTSNTPESVIYLSAGRYFYHTAAVLRIMKDMKGGWQFFYAFIIIPPFLRDAIYNLVSRYRYRISGKKRDCGLI